MPNSVPHDPLRSALSLANAVTAACSGQRTAFAGRTFGDFLRACRQLGILDEDELGSIEHGVSQHGLGHIVRDVDDYGALEIREVVR